MSEVSMSLWRNIKCFELVSWRVKTLAGRIVRYELTAQEIYEDKASITREFYSITGNRWYTNNNLGVEIIVEQLSGKVWEWLQSIRKQIDRDYDSLDVRSWERNGKVPSVDQLNEWFGVK